MKRNRPGKLLLLLLLCLGFALVAGCGATAVPAVNEMKETDGTVSQTEMRTETDSETKTGALSSPEANNGEADASPVVYFTSDISAEGLVRIYEALGWTPTGKVAVKIVRGKMILPPRCKKVLDVRKRN